MLEVKGFFLERLLYLGFERLVQFFSLELDLDGLPDLALLGLQLLTQQVVVGHDVVVLDLHARNLGLQFLDVVDFDFEHLLELDDVVLLLLPLVLDFVAFVLESLKCFFLRLQLRR